MDGVLLIDKPKGPTSHDVVARMRRTSGERRIGHTGTLDPLATGLLPLVMGRATRLASTLTAGDKSYDAEIRLGVATETDDAEGAPTGPAAAALPADAEIDRVLTRFRGTFEQVPPSHSAKKVAGRRAYELARAGTVALAPVGVTVHTLEYLARQAEDLILLRVTASAGFYVRALARDVGRALGCGAHVAGLRRTRSGAFDVARALPLDEAERMGPAIAERLIQPADAVADLPAVDLTEAGLKRVVHGNPIGSEDSLSSRRPEYVEGRALPDGRLSPLVRLLAPDGRLVALAEARHGFLHPVVVLG